MRSGISARRALLLLPWIALAVLATLVQGLPGHTVPFFTGDLGYHIATARSMAGGDLNGTGPYVGLPSYYGGVFPLVIALFTYIGADATTSVTVLSWFEPLMWLIGGAYLARTLWPRSLPSQLTFCAFLLFGAGIGLSRTQQWVDAPNISGQVFWPLYPRDVALILLLFGTGLALRGRWLFAAVLAAIGIATEAQIGPIALALVVAAILVRHRMRSGWLRAAVAVAIGVVGSSWWWAPRVVWAANYGLQLDISSVRIDLKLTPTTIWHAYGLLLVPAIVGCASWATSRGSSSRGFLGLWALGAAALVVIGAAHPSGFLTVRRTLVLASLPILIAAVDGISVAAHALTVRPTMSSLGVAIAALCILLVSAPTLAATRSRVIPHWVYSFYGLLRYPGSEWNSVWEQLREDQGTVLSAPGDATMAWLQSGRPQLWMLRPGYIKVGFDVGSVTGWSESARQAAVQSAFTHGPDPLCALAMRRGASDILLRSLPGYLGVTDLSGGVADRIGLLTRGATTIDDDSAVVANMPPGNAVNLAPITTDATRVLQVWQTIGGFPPLLTLLVDGRPQAPRQVIHEGVSYRTDFVLPRIDRGTRLKLINRTDHRIWLVRIVGYVDSVLATSGPASVLSTTTFCRSFAH